MTEKKKVAKKKAPAKKKVVKLDEVVNLIKNRITINFNSKLVGEKQNDFEVSATWTPADGTSKAEFKEQVQKEIIEIIAASILE